MSKEKEAAVRAELVEYQTALDYYKASADELQKQRSGLTDAQEAHLTKLNNRIKGELAPHIDFLMRKLIRIEGKDDSSILLIRNHDRIVGVVVREDATPEFSEAA